LNNLVLGDDLGENLATTPRSKKDDNDSMINDSRLKKMTGRFNDWNAIQASL